MNNTPGGDGVLGQITATPYTNGPGTQILYVAPAAPPDPSTVTISISYTGFSGQPGPQPYAGTVSQDIHIVSRKWNLHFADATRAQCLGPTINPGDVSWDDAASILVPFTINDDYSVTAGSESDQGKSWTQALCPPIPMQNAYVTSDPNTPWVGYGYQSLTGSLDPHADDLSLTITGTFPNIPAILLHEADGTVVPLKTASAPTLQTSDLYFASPFDGEETGYDETSTNDVNVLTVDAVIQVVGS